MKGLFERAVPASIIYPLALLLGIALSASIFPLSALWPGIQNDPAFAIDPAQHILGQRYFIADTWHWPPLDTRLLAGPAGTNIALTDSIPLMALLAKAVRAVLPPGFHTIYLWLALSYTLQSAAAVFALRCTGERRLLPCLAAAGIGASMPAWFMRLSHAALSGHFIILAALGLSWRISRGQSGAIFLATTTLLVAALLVHPYLMMMAAALLAAAPLSLLLRGDRLALTSGLGVGIGLAVTALIGMVLGYGAAQPLGGFETFSMNLLSPVYPQYSTLLPSLPPLPDPTEGQYEGYNYLGAGALLLAAVAVMSLGAAGQRRAALRHAGLVPVCLALTLFALSNHIYLGAREIVDLGPVPDALDQFRASGRFFWPVAYVIVIGGIAAVARLGRSWSVAGLLVTATLLQIADTHKLRAEVARVMNQRNDWGIDVEKLRPLMAVHRSLTVLPVYGCGPDHNENLVPLLLLASEYIIPVNTMYVARFVHDPDCGTAPGRTPLKAGELRVFFPAVEALMVPGAAGFCRSAGVFGVCSLQTDKLQKLPPVFTPGSRIATSLPLQSPGSILVSGWYEAESDGTWSNGPEATIAAPLAEPIRSGPIRLTVWGAAIAPESGGSQTISVAVNGSQVAVWTMPDMKDMELRAEIPADLVSGPTIPITFTIAAPTRPIDRDMNDDTRRLGLDLTAFRIDTVP